MDNVTRRDPRTQYHVTSPTKKPFVAHTFSGVHQERKRERVAFEEQLQDYSNFTYSTRSVSAVREAPTLFPHFPRTLRRNKLQPSNGGLVNNTPGSSRKMSLECSVGSFRRSIPRVPSHLRPGYVEPRWPSDTWCHDFGEHFGGVYRESLETRETGDLSCHRDTSGATLRCLFFCKPPVAGDPRRQSRAFPSRLSNPLKTEDFIHRYTKNAVFVGIRRLMGSIH